MVPMSNAIEIHQLKKVFKTGAVFIRALTALDSLDLTVRQGEVFGLLGPNGSGKSTTIKICLDLVRPTSGECLLFGEKTSHAKARQRVGYVPEAPLFYGYLSGLALMDSMGRFSGMSGKELVEARNRTLELVELADAAERPIRTYSKGMLQRLALAQALVHDPDLIILDEPTAGVDPIGSNQITDLIRYLKKEGKTILLCSHLLSQVESVCDRVAILHRGVKLVEGTMTDLAKVTDADHVLRFSNPEDGTKAEEILRKEGLPFTRQPSAGGTLEDVFLSLVQQKSRPKPDNPPNRSDLSLSPASKEKPK